MTIPKFIKDFLKSSKNPEKMSLTVKGILLALVPGTLFIVGLLGFDLTRIDLINLINSGVIILSGLITFYGLLRKIIINSKRDKISEGEGSGVGGVGEPEEDE